MQKAKQTTMSELALRADYVAPQVVCHSIEIEGVLASSILVRDPDDHIGFGDTRPTDDRWIPLEGTKTTEEENW